MRARDEEEPDEPDEPDEAPAAAAAGPVIPSVGPGAREYEFKLDLLTLEQVKDGKSLPDMLAKASTDGWDLYDVIDAGDKRGVLLRRPKKNASEPRRVGFAPPGAR
jgi:hypothetical protein